MDLGSDMTGSESRFAAFVEKVAGAVENADRVAPVTAYCTGLMLPGDRKSVEPMAAKVEPGRVQSAHQSLHHFVAKADWADGAVRELVIPVITSARIHVKTANPLPSLIRFAPETPAEHGL